HVTPDPNGKFYTVSGDLKRGDERLGLNEAALLVAGGLVFTRDRVARFDDYEAFEWVSLLQSNGVLTVPVKQKDELLKQLLRLPRLPRLDLPEELRFEEVKLPPRPRLKIKKADRPA